MLEYLAYGAIGISMATAILTFRLLSSEQKKEHPNDSILKMIKWFMGLTVFFAIFFGVIELIDKEEINGELSLKKAAEHLKDSDSSRLILGAQPGTENAAVYLNYSENQNLELGELESNKKGKLAANKSKFKEIWDVSLGKTTLGNIHLEAKEHRIMADSTNSKQFMVGEWYSIGDSDFWFRIDEISGRSPNYLYTVSFGEGTKKSSIISSDRQLEYRKTVDGFIFLNQPLKPISHEKWTYQYYVKFGAGLATNNSTSVQKINVQAIRLKID